MKMAITLNATQYGFFPQRKIQIFQSKSTLLTRQRNRASKSPLQLNYITFPTTRTDHCQKSTRPAWKYREFIIFYYRFPRRNYLLLYSIRKAHSLSWDKKKPTNIITYQERLIHYTNFPTFFNQDNLRGLRITIKHQPLRAGRGQTRPQPMLSKLHILIIHAF